jgi:hypothetical protein
MISHLPFEFGGVSGRIPRLLLFFYQFQIDVHNNMTTRRVFVPVLGVDER